MLFHVSEEAGITRFEPRQSERTSEPVVWAVDAAHLRNYVLPRDCPRVTCYATSNTTRADVEAFLGTSRAEVAVEDAVMVSTLQFSMIRMRNALPRGAASSPEP